jgi:LysM repeat protein
VKLQSGARLPAVDLTVRHRVRHRETLNSIAADYHVSARALALANGIGRRRPLRRGMILTVPASPGSPAVAQLEDGDPRASTSYVPSRNIAPPRQVLGKSDAEGRTVHTVHRHETLASIAAQYGVSADDLRRWNHLKSNSVRRGTRLKVRTGESGASSGSRDGAVSAATPVQAAAGPIAATASAHNGVSPVDTGPNVAGADADDSGAGSPADGSPGDQVASGSSSATTATHVIVVRRGVTLGILARQHGTSVRQLMKLNGLRTSHVRAGQRLRVPMSGGA